jgi:hypothetical protein
MEGQQFLATNRLFTKFKLIKHGNTEHCLYWALTGTRKDFIKYGIPLNAGTLNWYFTAPFWIDIHIKICHYSNLFSNSQDIHILELLG